MSQPHQCYNSLRNITKIVTITQKEIIFYMGDGRIMQSEVKGFKGNTVIYGIGLESTFVHKLDKTIEQLFTEQPDLIIGIN